MYPLDCKLSTVHLNTELPGDTTVLVSGQLGSQLVDPLLKGRVLNPQLVIISAHLNTTSVVQFMVRNYTG